MFSKFHCALMLFLLGSLCSAQETQPAASLQFSGRRWVVKHADQPVGPGPNVFSSRNIRLDGEGRLHLRIANEDDRWTCAEIGTADPTGYGTYIFHITTPSEPLDRNVVLGLFTWNNDSFTTDANSEIDIELSPWAVDRPEGPNLHYTVQPLFGPEEADRRYSERGHSARIALPTQTTHIFQWLPDRVRFTSYEGHGTDGKRLADWTFLATLARRAGVGDKHSQPVSIPQPGNATHARINLWLTGPGGNPSPPADRKPVEVIINRFVFIPHEEPPAASEGQ
jgi:hypothetical protein